MGRKTVKNSDFLGAFWDQISQPLRPLTVRRYECDYLFLQQAQLTRHTLYSNTGLLQLFVGGADQVAVPVG